MPRSDVHLASFGRTNARGVSHLMDEDGEGEGQGPSQGQHAVEDDQSLCNLPQSKRIPYWLWFLLARALGIKLHPDDRPIVASLMHILTMVAGGGMFFTRSWYSGYEIGSDETTTDLLDGMVVTFMVSLYCCVGVYAHRLAYRLFVHPKFVEKMRLHSKTIMKVNTATVVFLVSAGFVVTQNLALANFAYGLAQGNATEAEKNPCQTIQIPLPICQSYYVFQMVFSFFFLTWNVIVAVVLISVARTHTIDIRRFIRELTHDAHLQDKQFRKEFYPHESIEAKDSIKEYIWIDNDRIALVIQNVSKRRRAVLMTAEPRTSAPTDTSEAVGGDLDQLEDDSPLTVRLPKNVQLQLNDDEPAPTRRGLRRLQRLFSEHVYDDDDRDDVVTSSPHIMSEQEIMHKYWKLVMSIRLTSRAFQRWMCSFTVTILMWSTIRVVYWLSHTPTLYGVLSFILPLLLLPLMASAYAEVNYEGVKVIQSILPTQQRITMFLYMHRVPIQMTAYGHIISYGTMGTVIAAIIAAFASKILLQELNPVIN